MFPHPSLHENLDLLMLAVAGDQHFFLALEPERFREVRRRNELGRIRARPPHCSPRRGADIRSIT